MLIALLHVQGGNTSETTSQHLLGEGGQSIYQRDAVTCVLKSNPIKFADLGITNVARPTVMDIKRCSGGCSFEKTYSNKGVKHTELMARQVSSNVSCRPLTYGATTVVVLQRRCIRQPCGGGQYELRKRSKVIVHSS